MTITDIFRKSTGLPDYGELPLSRIPLSDKFFLSIVKQVDMGPKVIILDEILDKLNSTQLSKTISILRERADAGVAIVLITNNIEEVYNIAEDVSILKNGKLIYGDDIRKIEKINLIKLAYIEISKSDSGAVADQAFYQLLKYNEAILYELPINLLIIDREMVVKIANKSARSFFMMDNHVQLDIPVERLFHDNTPIFIAIVKAFDRQEATILHNILLELGEKPVSSEYQDESDIRRSGLHRSDYRHRGCNGAGINKRKTLHDRKPRLGGSPVGGCSP
jgi:hypothetical protein